MIIKERKIPTNILKLEALLRRLPSNYPKRKDIEQQLARRRAGYNGEQSLDYYLSFLDPKTYSIFHDLRLSNGSQFFQIDTFLLTPYFGIILEIKNISGTLSFNPSLGQLVRLKDGIEEGFPSPFQQAIHQRTQLLQWITTQKSPTFPIEILVVISNPSTIIKIDSNYNHHYQKLCHTSNLLEKIQRVEGTYKREIIPPKDLKRLNKLLIKNHATAHMDVLLQYKIPYEDLLTGVHCPECSYIPMTHIYGYWQCPACQYKSKDAHEQAISDYFLLRNSIITNQQFRNFTNISCKHLAYRLLSSTNLSWTGTKKGRIYHSPHTPHK